MASTFASYGEQHATTCRGPLPLAADGVSARPRTALPAVRNPGFRPGNAGSIPAPCTSQRPRPQGSARSLQALARPLTATLGHPHQRRLGCTRQQGVDIQARVTRALTPGHGRAPIAAGVTYA